MFERIMNLPQSLWIKSLFVLLLIIVSSQTAHSAIVVSSLSSTDLVCKTFLPDIVVNYDSDTNSNLNNNKGVVCKVARIKVEELDPKELIAALNSIDNDAGFHRIHIDYRSNQVSTMNIASCVDVYLAQKPWWILISQGKNPKVLHSQMRHIIILREFRLETQLRRLSYSQFPLHDQCYQGDGMITTIHGGIGQESFDYFEKWSEAMHQVSLQYDVTQGRSNRIVYIQIPSMQHNIGCSHDPADANIVANDIDKGCVFLPWSSCELPTSIISNSTFPTNSIDQFYEDNRMPRVTWQSVEGSLTPGSHIVSDMMVPSKIRIEDSNRLSSIGVSTSLFPDKFGYLLDADGVYHRSEVLSAEKVFGQPGSIFSVASSLVVPSMLLRPNHRARHALYEYIDSYRSQHKFPLGLISNCITVHIPRGLKSADSNNADTAEELCQKWELRNDGYCYRKDKDQRGSQSNLRSDKNLSLHRLNASECRDKLAGFGCFARRPFQSLTLMDYLLAAKRLLQVATLVGSGDSKWSISAETHTVVLITDDKEWVQDQLGDVTSDEEWQKWKIHIVAPPFSRDLDQQKLGVSLSAPVYMARQCPAFVGNFASSYSSYLFQAMCYQHGTTLGQCPPVVDVGRKYTPEGNIVDDCFICQKKLA